MAADAPCQCAASSRQRLSRVFTRLYADLILFRLPTVYARAHENLLDAWNAAQSGDAPPEEFAAEWDCFSRDLQYEWRRVYIVSQIFFLVTVVLSIYMARDWVANTAMALAIIAAWIACCYGFSYTVLMPDISGAEHGEMWMLGAERIASWRTLPMILAASSASIIWAMLTIFACLLCMYAGLVGLYDLPEADPEHVLSIPLGVCIALACVAFVGLAQFGASFWTVRKLARGHPGIARSRDGTDGSPLDEIERVGLLEDGNLKSADSQREA